MSQFVRIGATFINLETVRMVEVNPEIPQVNVTWAYGDTSTFVGDVAVRVMQALETLKSISLALPSE